MSSKTFAAHILHIMDNIDINVLALAYLGDAVYELKIRELVVLKIKSGHADLMHKESVKYVCASAQSKAVKKMISESFFNEEELLLLKRARNHKIATKAKNASVMDYRYATAFEALIGYVHISNNYIREDEIIKKAILVLSDE